MKRLARNEKTALWKQVNSLYKKELVADPKDAERFIRQAWKKFASQPHPSLNSQPNTTLTFCLGTNNRKHLKAHFHYFINTIQFVISPKGTWKDVAHRLSHFIAYHNTGTILHTSYQYMIEKQVAEFGSGRFWNELST